MWQSAALSVNQVIVLWGGSVIAKCVTVYVKKEFHIHCSYVHFALEHLLTARGYKVVWLEKLYPSWEKGSGTYIYLICLWHFLSAVV